jgi:NDP-sugar pyrophosphorylase family protein
MKTALIMAGGRSERMRASSGNRHKALIPVLGVPMLERNLCALLAFGFDDIVVATNDREPEIASHIRQCASLLAPACTLRCYSEPFPLGTIGAAGRVHCGSDPLLVVNVDNLTTLDLNALVDHHRRTGAALTVATHIEPFRIPFGQVIVQDGRVVEYREKPSLPVHLCSGTYVLGSRARALIPGDRPMDAPELVTLLLQGGDLVASFEHQSPWIDVNDARSLQQAEELIQRYFEAFERLRLHSLMTTDAVTCGKAKL